MRIFLDVGAHVGDTVEEVIKPEYRFDRIVAFEPSAACLPSLKAIAASDPRVQIVQAGLSNRDGKASLFQAGSVAGSVVGELDATIDHGDTVEHVELIEAGPWLAANTGEQDLVVMKLNCEGSEVDVIENLLDTDMLKRLYVLMVSWDIRMYPGGLARERALRKRLKASGLDNCCSSDDGMIGPSHGLRIAFWLKNFGLTDAENNPQALRAKYAAAFARFSRSTGRLHRLEHAFKQRISYDAFPLPIRRALQGVKRGLGLNRERQG